MIKKKIHFCKPIIWVLSFEWRYSCHSHFFFFFFWLSLHRQKYFGYCLYLLRTFLVFKSMVYLLTKEIAISHFSLFTGSHGQVIYGVSRFQLPFEKIQSADLKDKHSVSFLVRRTSSISKRATFPNEGTSSPQSFSFSF